MMEYTHYTTLFSMLQALTAGLFWGVYYDVFRILRRMIHFHRLSVAFQDLFFWITSAVFIFFVCIRLNNGFIRLYFVVFALTGWAVYFATVGRFAFAVFDGIHRFIRRILSNGKRRSLWILTKIIYKYRP